jgi:hypothetical protein
MRWPSPSRPGRARTGQRHRLRLRAAGPRQAWATTSSCKRAINCSAWPQGSEHHGGASQRTGRRAAVPFDFDREKASAFGLTMADINNTLAAAWGSGFVNDFIDRVASSGSSSRATNRACCRRISTNGTCATIGQMVPFSAFATGTGPRFAQAGALQRRPLGGNPGYMPVPGQSTGAAHGRHGKAGDASCPRASPTNGPPFPMKSVYPVRRRALYAISLIVVFLCLAALYESWSIPFAVMLVVPLGIFGAILATLLAGTRQRRLFPGGPAHHHRALGEERDSDRRVREGKFRAGHGAGRGDRPRGTSVCGRSS